MANPNPQARKRLPHPSLSSLSLSSPSIAVLGLRPRCPLSILWVQRSPEFKGILLPAQAGMEERRPGEAAWPVYFWRALRPKEGGRKPGQAGPRAHHGLPGAAPGPGAAVAEPPGG